MLNNVLDEDTLNGLRRKIADLDLVLEGTSL